MSYTKGEWEPVISRVTGGDFYSVVTNYRKHQFEIAKIMPIKEDKANAYLIALAPNMYATCQDYDNAIGRAIIALSSGVSLTTVVKEILLPAQENGRRILAKAEGKG